MTRGNGVIETLYCKSGDHEWERQVAPGPKPSNCPEHKNGVRPAPSHGYSSIEKARYRERVWGAMSEQLGELSDGCDALLMPSRGGEELEVAVSNGFAPARLHAVEENPAELAHAEWKDDYPNVHRYGSELGRACERIANKSVRIGAANLDFNGNFSRPVFESICGVRQSGVLDDACVVGVTMLKGRESTETTFLLKMLAHQLQVQSESCDKRVAIALQVLLGGRHYWMLDSGEYRSQTQHMVWGVAAAVSREREGEELLERFDRVDRMCGGLAIILEAHDRMHQQIRSQSSFPAGGPRDLRWLAEENPLMSWSQDWADMSIGQREDFVSEINQRWRRSHRAFQWAAEIEFEDLFPGGWMVRAPWPRGGQCVSTFHRHEIKDMENVKRVFWDPTYTDGARYRTWLVSDPIRFAAEGRPFDEWLTLKSEKAPTVADAQPSEQVA